MVSVLCPRYTIINRKSFESAELVVSRRRAVRPRVPVVDGPAGVKAGRFVDDLRPLLQPNKLRRKMIPDALPLLVPEPNHSTLLSDRF
jgi:hypothetical protein